MSINLNKILGKIVEKAKKDNIITEEESELIETIQLKVDDINEEIRELKQNQEKTSIIKRLLTSAGREMIKAALSKAREDGLVSHDERNILEVLINEFGVDVELIKNRPWYVFKVCINIDHDDDIELLLDNLDKIFCLRGMDPERVYSGLCLGTKHYVIDDVDVTLLAFAVTPDTTEEWVRKGAFATFDFQPENFDRTLKRTAEDLFIENYYN